jgi:hypothetical protein
VVVLDPQRGRDVNERRCQRGIGIAPLVGCLRF